MNIRLAHYLPPILKAIVVFSYRLIEYSLSSPQPPNPAFETLFPTLCHLKIETDMRQGTYSRNGSMSLQLSNT